MNDPRKPSSASALKKAIATFVEEHADDETMKTLVDNLGDVSEQLAELPEPEPELTPGQRSARSVEDEPETDEPKAEVEDDREPPKSFSDASGRAKERFAKKTSPSPEGKTPDARGREGAATASDGDGVSA